MDGYCATFASCIYLVLRMFFAFPSSGPAHTNNMVYVGSIQQSVYTNFIAYEFVFFIASVCLQLHMNYYIQLP